MSKEQLLNMGFRDAGFWHTDDSDNLRYDFDGEYANENRLLSRQPNALYAFLDGDVVKYVGKTTRSIQQRFIGYRTPGAGQATNLRCNTAIRRLIALRGSGPASARFLIFLPISNLFYDSFRINLAAGLEDALIEALQPEWNGRNGGLLVTETAELETEATEDNALLDRGEIVADQSSYPFDILLGTAYFRQGIINPGTTVSTHLGEDGGVLIVQLGTNGPEIQSAINRRATPNGSVRVVGNNWQIAEWFQTHFRLGDTVHAEVLGPNLIRLNLP